MNKNYNRLLEKAKSLADIFELVKSSVWENMGMTRGGLMLGLADLGNMPEGFFGAFFSVGSNIIVMNITPLKRIRETQPELYKPYAFHVLLHEYLHTLGYMDEHFVRRQAYEISKGVFGESHLVTQIAEDTRRFFPSLVYPNLAWQPSDLDIELVEGFDRSSIGYIA